MKEQKIKCYIFAGAPGAKCSGIDFEENKYVICADGGYLLAKNLGIKPDVIIGDFDTYQNELPNEAEVIKYSPEKDDTDTMLAVKLALNRGFINIVICGAVGGRLDHTIANIQTLKYILKHGGNGELAGDGSFVSLQTPGIKVYSKMHGYYFSIFSYSDESSGISATGFKYPMKNMTLKNSFPLGISNKVIGNAGIISLEKGLLLIIISKDMNQNR